MVKVELIKTEYLKIEPKRRMHSINVFGVFIYSPKGRKRGKYMKYFNHISIIVGIVGGCIARWLGGWDMLLKTIVFLAVMDYATGVIKGLYTKTLSSDIGFKGLLKKIVMFIVIAVAFSIQTLLNDTVALREIVIMFYICNEALSLLENAAMFIPIPDKLKDVLLQLRDSNESEEK